MLKDAIRQKMTKLTDEDRKFLREMKAEEHAAFMETVISDEVCEKYNEIRKAKGDLAGEKFLDDKLLEGINQYRDELALEPERERLRAAIREGILHKRQEGNALVKDQNQDSEDALLTLTVKKIMAGKMGGKEISYVEALLEAQRENPELAVAIKAQMDDFRNRNNPPPPWER